MEFTLSKNKQIVNLWGKRLFYAHMCKCHLLFLFLTQTNIIPLVHQATLNQIFTTKWVSNYPKYLRGNEQKHILKIIFCWLKCTLAGMFEVFKPYTYPPMLQFKERKYKMWIGRPTPPPTLKIFWRVWMFFFKTKIWIDCSGP